MITPSPDWTPAERLALLHDLAVVSWHEPDTEVRDQARMVVLCVTDDSAYDLELNRDVIMVHAKRADEIMQGLAACRRMAAPPPEPPSEFWKVVPAESGVQLVPPNVDFTELFFEHAQSFRRALSPVFRPKPKLLFHAKSFHCWLDVEATEHELDDARVRAMASTFAPAIAKQLTKRMQRYVYSVHIQRPICPTGSPDHYLVSRYYQLFARTTRPMTAEEEA